MSAQTAHRPSLSSSAPAIVPKAEWVPDAHALECSTCALPFTSLFRRHHCRQCGRVICSPCSTHSAELTGGGEGKAVRICIECWCDMTLKRRGVTHEALLSLLHVRLQPSNKSVIAKAVLLHDMAVIEQEIAEAERRWTEKLMDAAERHAVEDAQAEAAGLSDTEKRARQEQREHDEDVAREERTFKFNLIGQQAASIHDQLSAIRHEDGLVVTVVKHEKDMKDICPWLVRLLLLTPTAPRVLALSSFLYPNPSVEISQHNKALRWHTVRTVDQITAVRAGEVKVAGITYKAFTVVFQPSTPPAKEAEGGAAAASTTAKDAVVGVAAGVAAALRKSAGAEDELVLLFTDNTGRSAMDSLYSFVFPAGVQEESEEAEEEEKRREMESAWQWDSQSELQHTLRLHMKAQQDRTRSAMRQLERIHADMKTAVTWEDPTHADLLTHLYALYAPPSFPPFPGVKGEAWKRLGFQGEDPTTDFRGMGLLSLRCLLYMGERHPEAVKALVAVVDVRPYPLCAAGINVVALLCELLGLTGKELPFVSTAHSIMPTSALFQLPLFRVLMRGDGATQVEELFCCLMQLMDAMVVRSGVSYLQFQDVMRRLKDRLLDVARDEVVGVDVLMQRLHELDADEQVEESVRPAGAAESNGPADAVEGGRVRKGISRLQRAWVDAAAAAGVSSPSSATSADVSDGGDDEQDEIDLLEAEKVKELQAALQAEEERVREELADADRHTAAAVLHHTYAARDDGIEPMERHVVDD